MTLYPHQRRTQYEQLLRARATAVWPPLFTDRSPHRRSTGATASMLGTTKRDRWTTQVTYNGWPLYYWVKDKAVGDTTGENVQGVWFVITPLQE